MALETKELNIELNIYSPGSNIAKY